MNEDYNDEDLLQGLAENNKKIIEHIYQGNFSRIQSFVFQYYGFSDDARDIFQEAMVVLYEKAKSSNFELSCQIKTYLFAVCKRLWYKKLQNRNKINVVENFLEEEPVVEEDIEQHEKISSDLKLLKQSVNQLGDPCKSILEAYYFEDLSMEDIAKKFGYTNADNAKNQKYKCMKRLKKLFFSSYKSE